jgi:LysM repeat protein
MYCINYVIHKGDTLYSMSRHFNVSLNAIMYANPLVNVYHLEEGNVLAIPVSVPQNNYKYFTTYLITKEDTLGRILDENSINLADLMEFNSLDNIYLLPGTTLQVPVLDDGEDDVT